MKPLILIRIGSRYMERPAGIQLGGELLEYKRNKSLKTHKRVWHRNSTFKESLF